MSYPRTSSKLAKPAKKAKRIKVVNKYCWVARETSRGWRVALGINEQTCPISGALFQDPNTIHWLLGGGKPGIVFVHMRNSAWTTGGKSGKMFLASKVRTK